MKKNQVLVLAAVILGLFLFARGGVPRFPVRVIRDFRLFKDRYVTVANYIESIGWEKYGLDQDKWFGSISFSDSEGGAVSVSCAEEYRDIGFPEESAEVKRAARFLFRALRYSSIRRTGASGNTIVFTIKPYFFDWNYYNEGVCYVIDGGEPTPELNYDYVTEYLQPLGDNWYYWNGHCYFAPSVGLP